MHPGSLHFTRQLGANALPATGCKHRGFTFVRQANLQLRGRRQGRGLFKGPMASSDPKGTTNRKLPDLKTIKGVLFDVDGTLTDSDTLHFQAFVESLQKYNYNEGQPITREFFDEHLSGGQNNLLGKFLWPEWSKERQDAYCVEKEEKFRELAAGKLKPLKGLNEYLDWIKRKGLKTAAVTNAPKPNVEAMLAGIGLSDFFEHVVLGELFENPKPYPDPYLEGLKLVGLNKEDCIIHEDSPAGTTAGVAAGIPVICLLTSQTAERLNEVGSTLNIKDYTEMMKLIEEHGAL